MLLYLLGIAKYLLKILAPHMSGALAHHTLWIVYAFMFLVACSVCVSLFLPLYTSLCDRRALARAKAQYDASRAQIGAVFRNFRTASYRLKYVQWLEAHCERAPKDWWPESRRPNIDNDTASILLAQPDERWLGLDR